MKPRRVTLLTITLFAVVIMLLLGTIFRKIEVTSPSVPQQGTTRIPEVAVDEVTGMLSIDITVLIYNIAGLPWPIGCGKFSRLTDEKGKRYPIACNRSSGARNIGDMLGQLRATGLEPDIVMLQEAFVAASAEIPIRAEYPNWVSGPGPAEPGPKFSDRASVEFIAERSFWKGEKLGKRQPSGLLIASNFPIIEQLNFPFYAWECAILWCTPLSPFDSFMASNALMTRRMVPSPIE